MRSAGLYVVLYFIVVVVAVVVCEGDKQIDQHFCNQFKIFPRFQVHGVVHQEKMCVCVYICVHYSRRNLFNKRMKTCEEGKRQNKTKCREYMKTCPGLNDEEIKSYVFSHT